MNQGLDIIPLDFLQDYYGLCKERVIGKTRIEITSRRKRTNIPNSFEGMIEYMFVFYHGLKEYVEEGFHRCL